MSNVKHFIERVPTIRLGLLRQDREPVGGQVEREWDEPFHVVLRQEHGLQRRVRYSLALTSACESQIAIVSSASRHCLSPTIVEGFPQIIKMYVYIRKLLFSDKNLRIVVH